MYARLAILVAVLACTTVHAQTPSPVVEQFTGTTTANPWYFYDGACLTAGTSAATSNPGAIPGCTSILPTYYTNQTSNDPALVGGDNGFLGANYAPPSLWQQQADLPGSGALRFTNGAPYGAFETGAIISKNTFSTTSGLQITFKTVTYRGYTVSYDNGMKGYMDTGADGIGFFLLDGAADLSRFPGVGANGGSLGYSCSNTNFDTAPRSPGMVRGYDGMVGAYLGVGVDEFGNFLDGTVNTLGLPSTFAGGDNTATGGGYLPNTVGLRGAGNVSWGPLSAAYGNNPYNSSSPYYPANLSSQCPAGGGTYDWARG